MTVGIRVSPSGPPLGRHRRSPPMRRSFIYPHRSVRAIPARVTRFVVAGLTVLALTAAMAQFFHPLLVLHNRLCLAIVELCGIPIAGVLPVELFAQLGPAPVPVIAVPQLSDRSLEVWTLFTATMLVLLGLHRRIPFARSLLLLLMTLLVMTLGVVVFHPASQFGSVEFAAMWLRSELLVWMVLPFLSVSIFVLTQPTMLFGVAWAMLTQIYGLAWSAIRLAFGIAMIHYTGILFAPIFWFAGGLLADVIYLVVFYSVAIQWAARGKRAQ